jgi:hypothetical protein
MVSTPQSVYVTAADDPGLIGAFGTGADPVWQAAASFPPSSPMLKLSSIYSKAMKDWRVMDIVLDGSLVSTPTNLWGITLWGGLDQATFLRITGKALTIPIVNSFSLLDAWNVDAVSLRGHHIWDQLAIVDLRQIDTRHGVIGNTQTYPYGLFISGERMAIMGCSFDNRGDDVIGTSHNIRIQYAGKYIVANNDLANPGQLAHNLKLHSSNWVADPTRPNDPNAYTPPAGVTGLGSAADGVRASIGGGYTRWGYIADNKITGNYNAMLVAIGPHSDGVQNRVRDVVVEGNWIRHGVAGQRSMSLEGTYMTARNNLLDLSAAKIHYGIYVGKRAPSFASETTTDHIWVYNNTIYAGQSGSGFRGVWIEPVSASTNVTVKNNLAYAPNDPVGALLFGQAPNASGGNSSEISSIAANPKFVGPLTSPSGWRLGADSYARKAGVPVPVWRDFFDAFRPETTTGDIGGTQN